MKEKGERVSSSNIIIVFVFLTLLAVFIIGLFFGIPENIRFSAGSGDDCDDCDDDTHFKIEADGDDCNDSNANINPSKTELLCNEVDENCDGRWDIGTDSDGDEFYINGITTGGDCGPIDCNDSNSAVHPGAIEYVCNDVDEDCNGEAAQGTDSDGDGYKTEGWACGPTDCNDNDNQVNPGAVEDTSGLCSDGVDNDCNGDTDCSDDACKSIDGDNDGSLLCDGDCNDNDVDILKSFGLEVTRRTCTDGKDNDCNNKTDCQERTCCMNGICQGADMGSTITPIAIGGRMITLNSPQVCCGGRAVETFIDSSNCGSCGNSCGTMSCVYGVCDSGTNPICTTVPTNPPQPGFDEKKSCDTAKGGVKPGFAIGGGCYIQIGSVPISPYDPNGGTIICITTNPLGNQLPPFK
ncbi:MAG: MopE-related protein [Nanoarchaeota archaeon]